MLRTMLFALLVVLLTTPALWTDDAKDTPKKKPQKDQMPAGRAELLRPIPKKFGELKSKDESKRQVVIHFDGDKEPTTWNVNPDAELKQFGWWCRLKDFHDGTRVWVWLDINRQRKPKSVLMMCDEITQQEMNDLPYRLGVVESGKNTVFLSSPKKPEVAVQLAGTLSVKETERSKFQFTYDVAGTQRQSRRTVAEGDKVYLQRGVCLALLILGEDDLEALRQERRTRLKEEWLKSGLPGTVSILHPLSGEMEILLDHEAMRWGRALKFGDKVKLMIDNPIEAVVKESRPWRERTVVRLVMDGFAQHDLMLGQRVGLLVPTPPPEVDSAEYPPDIERPRSRPERVEWFLASTYCSCSVAGNGCTGMFYTLASCNVNACGMPNMVRAQVDNMIEKGMSDRQIWDELKKLNGAAMLKPHLMP